MIVILTYKGVEIPVPIDLVIQCLLSLWALCFMLASRVYGGKN